MGDILGGVGSVVGGIAGAGDREKALKAQQAGVDVFKNINPNVAMPDVAQGDPRTQAIQQQVMQQALQRARAGGLNAVDMGRLNAIRGQQAQQTKAGQAAALSEAQQRGATQGNTGILGALMAGQQAADTGANQAMQAGAIGQQSQNQANQQAAEQAGGLRQQNIGVEQGNITRKQAQANQNKGNEFTQAGGVQAGEGGVADQYGKNAQATQDIFGGAGKAIGSAASMGVGGALGGMDQWKKYLGM